MSSLKKKFASSAVNRIPIPKNLTGVEIASVIREPNGKLLFVIDPTARAEDSMTSWGMIIADFMRHVAQSLHGHVFKRESREPLTCDEIAGVIKRVFDAEWSEPTDNCEEVGRFLSGRITEEEKH